MADGFVVPDFPVWGPLEAILALEDCGGFMYMGLFEMDGERIHHYKHVITRRYLFVDDDLRTYRYLGDERYAPQGRKRSIRWVLEDLKSML